MSDRLHRIIAWFARSFSERDCRKSHQNGHSAANPLDLMHREDIKAAIRKRFGSVSAFERAHGLTEKSVNELLRGRTNGPARIAILAMLSDGGAK